MADSVVFGRSRVNRVVVEEPTEDCGRSLAHTFVGDGSFDACTFAVCGKVGRGCVCVCVHVVWYSIIRTEKQIILLPLKVLLAMPSARNN